MAIEQLGESLLAQARQKSKKREKKAKLFTGAMLGVLGGNMYLRSKAKKRVKEINESFQPVLDTHVRRFNEGVDFWKKHKDLLDEQNSNDWKEAYFNQELTKFKAGKDFKKDFETEKEIRNYVQEQIKDDIVAYQSQIDAYKDFKHFTTGTAKDNQTIYLRPIMKALAESQTKIANNANIGSALLTSLGLKEKDHLQQIVSGDTSVTVQGATDQTVNKLASFLDSARTNNNILEKGKEGVYYGVRDMEDTKLSSLFKDSRDSLSFKIEEWVGKSLNVLKTETGDDGQYNTVSIDVGGEAFRYYDIIDDLERKNEGTDILSKFDQDFSTVASILARKYEGKEYRTNAQILKEALNIVGQNIFLDPDDSNRLGYVPISGDKIRNAVEEKPIGLKAGERYIPNEDDLKVLSAMRSTTISGDDTVRQNIVESFINIANDKKTEEEKRLYIESLYRTTQGDIDLRYILPEQQRFFTGKRPTNNDKFDEEGKLIDPLNLGAFQSNSESIVEQFKIKPEYEKALTELSEKNVEELKSSFSSFVSNIEEGTNNMFNAIAQIDKDIISGELQERLIDKISKTIMPILKGDTIPQKDFADAIKDFARENNLRLEDIVSAIDYPWLYEITGVKNRNIGREKRREERAKIKQNRLLVENLIEDSPRNFDQLDQTGLSSLLKMTTDKEEEIAKRKSQLSNRGTL